MNADAKCVFDHSMLILNRAFEELAAYFRASWTLISGHRGQRFQVIVDGRFTTIVDDFDGPDFRAVHDQRCGWR
jgi:hypothetical protein